MHVNISACMRCRGHITKLLQRSVYRKSSEHEFEGNENDPHLRSWRFRRFCLVEPSIFLRVHSASLRHMDASFLDAKKTPPRICPNYCYTGYLPTVAAFLHNATATSTSPPALLLCVSHTIRTFLDGFACFRLFVFSRTCCAQLHSSRLQENCRRAPSFLRLTGGHDSPLAWPRVVVDTAVVSAKTEVKSRWGQRDCSLLHHRGTWHFRRHVVVQTKPSAIDLIK